ncbi:MAG: hypothetical protein M0R17_08075 [Candidatus Omnitrophica bacterium]|jgi:hypothetical protein|nr:hypothetical protein [Candidatus Omnitrophota bacterium]
MTTLDNRIRIRIIILIIEIISLISLMEFTIGCTVYHPTEVYTPDYDNSDYAKWRFEQKQHSTNAYNYSQSAEFKKQYEGKSESYKINAPDAKSIINTEYDSMKDIRKPTSPLLPTNDIRVRVW